MAYYKYIRICKNCKREYKIQNVRESKYCYACRKDLGLIKVGNLYSSTFYRNRLIVFNRDYYKCRNCKNDNKTELHVHHIDVNTKNNSLSNLITLCGSCHSRLHGSYTKGELRKGNILTLFDNIKNKKMEEKLLFLNKVTNKIKPKKFFIHK